MLEWVIALLESFRTDGPAGEFAFATTVLLPLFGVYAGTRFWAKRRYNKDITEAADLRHQLSNREDTLADRDAEISDLKTEIAALKALGPDHLLARKKEHERDGNLELEIDDAQAFLDHNEDALFSAFNTLSNAALVEGSEDGAAAYESARLYALAALAMRPRDAELRDLIAELEQASAASATGAKVHLKDADRTARRAAKETLPGDLAALRDCFFAARDNGRFRMAFEFALHGARMSKRAGGPGTKDCLLFSRHVAEALWLRGRYDEALVALEQIRPAIGGAFGEDAPETLYTRYLIATILNDIGRHDDALNAAEALLPDYDRISGADDPNTLATRSLIAHCLNEIGQHGDALKAAEEIFPDRERVNGADHLQTLSARFHIARYLNDIGRHDDALVTAEALLPDEERVCGADHPHTLAAQYLIAQCLNNIGRHDDALVAVEAHLADRERASGADHPDTLVTKRLLAKIYLDLGLRDKAAAVFEGVLDGLRESGIQENHKRIQNALDVEQRLRSG